MKDDDYSLLVFLNDVIIAIFDCSLFSLFIFQDLTASGTVYIDHNLSFEYRDSMRYNYLSVSTDGTTLLSVSIDESNNEGFDLIIAEIITVSPEKSHDGTTFQIFICKCNPNFYF
jgi:hypothetical protein